MSKKLVLYTVVLVLVFTIFIPATSVGLRYSMNTDTSNVDASFIGRASGDISGKSVAIVGDVNGDGYDDILIGAPEAGYQNAGHTYLIFGKKKGWSIDSSLSDCDVTFTGDSWNRYAGYSVAGAGDFNGDGFDDILVGTPRFGGASQYGEAFLILGKSSGWSDSSFSSGSEIDFHGEHDGDVAGSSVAGAGDVNGDGFDDILIGAPTNDDGGINSGKTYLIFGNSSGWDFDFPLSNANASFYGENASDKSGYTIASAGDVNGDGYDDILIGAPNNDDGGIESGKTYLIFGNSTGWAKNVNLSLAEASFIGGGPGDKSGYSVAGAGDVNNDGYDDILIGAYKNDSQGSDAGITYLFFGKPFGWAKNVSLSLANVSFTGEDSGDYSGYSVAAAGDVNDDGYDDILIAAPEDEDGDTKAGQCYLILGKETGWLASMSLSNSNASFIGEEKWDYLGQAMAGGGDVNGDGYDDILLAAPDYDYVNEYPRGKTYLIFMEQGHLFLYPFEDNPTAYEDALYSQNYWVVGEWTSVELIWTFETNASWLEWDVINHTIHGVPKQGNVGYYWVRINVSHDEDSYAEHNFTVSVWDTNDPPEWIDIPSNTLIRNTEAYAFDINATDVDEYDRLEYRLIQVSVLGDKTYTASINETSGEFEFSNADVGLYQVKIGVTDLSIMIYHEFQIDVRSPSENLPPNANLISPEDDKEIEILNPTFRWTVADENGDICTSDLYLGTNLLYIQGLNPANKIGDALTGNSFTPTDPLEKGETYYWTVIPYDGTEYGICPSGVWSFTINESATINNLPVIESISNQTVKVGEEFTYAVQGSDPDIGDAPNLLFSLDSPPEGMAISLNGTITWTPEDAQVGIHTVTVRLSDGKGSVSTTFEIEVNSAETDGKGSEESPMSLLIIIIIVVVVVVLLLLLLMRKKKPKDVMYSPNGPSGEYDTSLGQQGEQSTGQLNPQITPERESSQPSDGKPMPLRDDKVPPPMP
jgi:hypothetical protein